MDETKVKTYCSQNSNLTKDSSQLNNKASHKSLISNHAFYYNLRIKKVKDIYKNHYLKSIVIVIIERRF